MPNRSQTRRVATTQLLKPQEISATTTSDFIDTTGFNAIEVIISVDNTTASSSNGFTPTLQDSDSIGTGTFATTTDFVGDALAIDITQDEKVIHVGYIGSKRYLRVVMTETGTAVSEVDIIAVVSRAANSPPTAPTPVTAV